MATWLVGQQARGAVLDPSRKHLEGASAVTPVDEVQGAVAVLAVERLSVGAWVAGKVGALTVLDEGAWPGTVRGSRRGGGGVLHAPSFTHAHEQVNSQCPRPRGYCRPAWIRHEGRRCSKARVREV